MTPRSQQPVQLGELLARPYRTDLTPLVLASQSSPVREIALVSNVEEITSLGPDTMIVLSTNVTRGSWMISAALRYAWERNACALIIPDRSLGPSIVRLAERFQISLLGTRSEASDVAIEVATQLGFARAQLVSSLHSLTKHVEEAESISVVLELASGALAGARVSLEASGAVIRSAASASPDPSGEQRSSHVPSRVSMRLGGAPAAATLLVTDVPARLREHAASVLEICATKLRALLAEAQLFALQQSLPLASLAALNGSRKQFSREPEISIATWSDQLGDVPYVALCIVSEHRERYGPALHQLWLAEFVRFPLVQYEEGWVAFIPLPDEAAIAEFAQAAKAKLFDIHLLDLRVGVSERHTGEEEIRSSVREAWLAARIAKAGEAGAIVRYGALPDELLPRLLPAPIAAEILRQRFPLLAADPHRDALIEAYCLYADSFGSATDTATRLGIHRNTVKQRLERLEELGIPVQRHTSTLGIHLLFEAVRSASSQ